MLAPVMVVRPAPSFQLPPSQFQPGASSSGNSVKPVAVHRAQQQPVPSPGTAGLLSAETLMPGVRLMLLSSNPNSKRAAYTSLQRQAVKHRVAPRIMEGALSSGSLLQPGDELPPQPRSQTRKWHERLGAHHTVLSSQRLLGTDNVVGWWRDAADRDPDVDDEAAELCRAVSATALYVQSRRMPRSGSAPALRPGSAPTQRPSSSPTPKRTATSVADPARRAVHSRPSSAGMLEARRRLRAVGHTVRLAASASGSTLDHAPPEEDEQVLARPPPSGTKFSYLRTVTLRVKPEEAVLDRQRRMVSGGRGRPKPAFAVGDEVQVTSTEPGFEGSYFPGKVVEGLRRGAYRIEMTGIKARSCPHGQEAPCQCPYEVHSKMCTCMMMCMCMPSRPRGAVPMPVRGA